MAVKNDVGAQMGSYSRTSVRLLIRQINDVLGGTTVDSRLLLFRASFDRPASECRSQFPSSPDPEDDYYGTLCDETNVSFGRVADTV